MKEAMRSHRRLGIATPRRRFLPRLDVLEDRRVLSTYCIVDRLSDVGSGEFWGEYKGDLYYGGDLRYCLRQQAVEAIFFATEPGTIELNAPLPALTRDLDIWGPGADSLAVTRNSQDAFRIFTVTTGRRVTISGLTLTNGWEERGGGIHNSGELLLIDSVLAGNTAVGGPFISEGGAIYNAGTLTVYRSTLSGNAAGVNTPNHSAYGAGIFNAERANAWIGDSTVSDNRATGGGLNGGAIGGGIRNRGHMTIENSTVAHNQADNRPWVSAGGGISSQGVLTILQSTISNNVALEGSGGGIHNALGIVEAYSSTVVQNQARLRGGVDSIGATFIMGHTILALNAGAFRDCDGRVDSQGHNIIGDDYGCSGFLATDIRNINPRLGLLADNGGPTQTHAPLVGSPAIDSGDNGWAFYEFDQRGPEFWRIANSALDRGAFEVQDGTGPSPGYPPARFMHALNSASVDITPLLQPIIAAAWPLNSALRQPDSRRATSPLSGDATPAPRVSSTAISARIWTLWLESLTKLRDSETCPARASISRLSALWIPSFSVTWCNTSIQSAMEDFRP